MDEMLFKEIPNRQNFTRCDSENFQMYIQYVGGETDDEDEGDIWVTDLLFISVFHGGMDNFLAILVRIAKSART
ncbi:hypothetical protein J6590_011475 [Homalodisca vitripennis]|nr:hypothetical protein J6590_011475 [Homalodisca vitripennis]